MVCSSCRYNTSFMVKAATPGHRDQAPVTSFPAARWLRVTKKMRPGTRRPRGSGANLPRQGFGLTVSGFCPNLSSEATTCERWRPADRKGSKTKVGAVKMSRITHEKESKKGETVPGGNESDGGRSGGRLVRQRRFVTHHYRM